ncbi:MAG: hypothetical protein E7253_02655 [Lachnospiraceae bacterium]|nr:hypothetical protein [Lachnospiraceae bacterium]
MVITKMMNSHFLNENVKIRIIMSDKQQAERIFILLHGKKNSDEDETMPDKMTTQLELEALCEKYHMMIAIPNMKNCYYISSDNYNCEKFISEELPFFLEQNDRSILNGEKMLGGISMGGYGAVLIGANTHVFRKVISISGSFIEKDIMIGNPEVWGSRKPTEESTKGTFLHHFLPLNELADARNKSAEKALYSLKERNNKTELYFSCGTKDWLYARNLALLQGLEEMHIPYKFYEISEGMHESRCFRSGLWMIFEEIMKNRG